MQAWDSGNHSTAECQMTAECQGLAAVQASTRGILLGTPHRDSNTPSWGLIARLLISLFLDSTPTILCLLQLGSSELRYLRERFSKIASGFRLFSFQEGHGMIGVAGLNFKACILDMCILLDTFNETLGSRRRFIRFRYL